MAWADRKALEQVLENLLTNAIRYSDEGSTITIEVEEHPDAIEIAVEDTGIGIPEEALDRIFERFYRVDASRSRAIGSTGLGLSIVRHLVQAHGRHDPGREPAGQGSRFRFTRAPRLRLFHPLKALPCAEASSALKAPRSADSQLKSSDSPPAARSPLTVFPSANSPCRIRIASGSWTSRWIKRFSGLAPYCGS